MALPTYQGVGAGAATASIASLAVAFPASLVRNDYIILHVTVRNTTTTVTTPTLGGTWSVIQTAIGAGSTTTGRHWIFGKKSEGNETGNLTVEFGTDAAVCKTARMYYFRNVDVVTPYEGGVTSKGTGTTVSATSLTTSGTDRLGLHFLYVTDDNAVASFTGESGGDWTEAVAEYTTTLGSDTCVQLQTAGLAAATTISGGTLTMAATDPYGCATVALRNGTDQRYVWDNIGVTDVQTATLSIDILNPTPPIEGIDVGETVTVNLPAVPIEINLYDGIGLTDTENILYPITIIVGEVVTVVISALPDLEINISQGVGTGETVTVQRINPPDLTINISQGIDVSESVTPDLSDPAINVQDGIGITDVTIVAESLAISIYDGIGIIENTSHRFTDPSPSVFDGIAIGESIEVVESVAGAITINLFENIGVSETVVHRFTDALISAIESIGVSEQKDFKFSDLVINVFDNAGLTENLARTENLGDILATESIGLAELVQLLKDIYLTVSDSIGISEYRNIVVSSVAPILIDAYENIGIAELALLLKDIKIAVTDGIGLGESAVLAKDIKVSVSDAVGIAETVLASISRDISISESLGIAEYISLYIEMKVESEQDIALREWTNVEMEMPGVAGVDTVRIGEYIAVRMVLSVGKTTMTFGSKMPNITPSYKMPEITFAHKDPEIVFSGE